MNKISFESAGKWMLADFDTPIDMDFWVSGQCNMRCRYCVHSLEKNHAARKNLVPGLLPWETFRKIADDLKAFPRPVFSANFCGVGEPLVHPRLEDMVAYLHEKKIVQFIELTTNALLLTRERAKRLLDSGINMLEISIQGVDEAGYERLCGVPADPRRIADVLTFVKEYKSPDTFLLVRTLDVALPGEEDEARFHELFDPIADQTLVANAVALYQGMDYSELIPVPKHQFGQESIRYTPACPLIFASLHARPNGDISVCPLPTCPEILGNIRDHTLPELWNSERRWKILLDHALCQRENCEACNGCTQPEMLAGGAQPSAGLAERIREHLEKSRSVK